MRHKGRREDTTHKKQRTVERKVYAHNHVTHLDIHWTQNDKGRRTDKGKHSMTNSSTGFAKKKYVVMVKELAWVRDACVRGFGGAEEGWVTGWRKKGWSNRT